MNEKIFAANVTISDVNSAETSGNFIVIYDGKCGFCKECVNWVERRSSIVALPFQSADLSQYGVTYERCSKEVILIMNKKVFGGADAVAKILRAIGYKNLASLLTLSGSFGQKGYAWVASHRNSALVKFATFLLRRGKKKS